MKDYSLVAILRRELEKGLFPNGMDREQINMLDQVEQSFKKAFNAGYKMGQKIDGEEWSNNACLGYVILGSRRLGYTEKQIDEIVRSTSREFDFKTIDEARVTYETSPY